MVMYSILCSVGDFGQVRLGSVQDLLNENPAMAGSGAQLQCTLTRRRACIRAHAHARTHARTHGQRVSILDELVETMAAASKVHAPILFPACVCHAHLVVL